MDQNDNMPTDSFGAVTTAKDVSQPPAANQNIAPPPPPPPIVTKAEEAVLTGKMTPIDGGKQ